jgi:hypothetical protein
MVRTTVYEYPSFSCFSQNTSYFSQLLPLLNYSAYTATAQHVRAQSTQSAGGGIAPSRILARVVTPAQIIIMGALPASSDIA